jgi:hypothetical protein
MQMPKALSKNISVRQVAQTSMLIGPITFWTTISQSMVTASAQPIAQAKRFWGAPVHSGTCLPTARRPTIMLGEYFGLMKMRIVKSIRKAITNILVGRKLPMNHALAKVNMANTKRMPAAARTSRSFSTGTS